MQIVKSRAPDVAIPEVSVTDYVLRHAEGRAERTAYVSSTDDREVTFAVLARQIRSFAGGLKARGVGPGTTWALMAPNLPEYAVVFHGLAYAGATVTTLNPTYGAEEIAFQLKDSKASAIVTVELFLPVARAAAKEAGVEEVIVIGPGDATPFTEYMGTPLEAQVDVPLADHVVVLPYSSGTTGFPKGVMLTHRNLVANLEQTIAQRTPDADDVCYAVLPFFHIYGMQILMNMTTAVGGKVVTAPRFDLVQMLESVQKHGITQLYLVPPIVLALAKHPIIDQYDLSSVKEIFSGAAPLGAEVADAAAKRIGCTIGQGYGMTEVSPVTHATKPDDYRPGSVGTLVASTEARFVDPDSGNDVGPGERGEIWVRGPQVMKGYLNNEDATAATIDADGWLHTGDVGKLRRRTGITYIVDRLKELIKYKGFQIAPAELEALLITHPGVVDVAVIGIPDDEAGEVPKAFIVRAEGADVTLEALQALILEHLTKYKQIQAVEFVDTIPKSASGKILRRELRARA